jgi:hypothetical protein
LPGSHKLPGFVFRRLDDFFAGKKVPEIPTGKAVIEGE